MKQINVAVAGVGNCVSSLVQGVQYYTENEDQHGEITQKIHGYEAKHVKFVAAFDVNETKVGRPLREAIYAEPNCTPVFQQVTQGFGDCTVLRGPTLDGIGEYVRDVVRESAEEPVDVAQALRDAQTDVLLCYMPVGSEQAARFYAQAALDAGCAFVNCEPVFIASDPEWAKKFRDANLPIIGDDIKSQLGATILHRRLISLVRDRGLSLVRTSQLNVGGNTDFLNMLERSRLKSKKISKTQAVASMSEEEFTDENSYVGPSDYVPFLKDNKWAHIHIEARGFMGARTMIEVKLEVVDSPNSAGVVLDALRYAKAGLDRRVGGPLVYPSAWLMKSPPVQLGDEFALAQLTGGQL